MSTHTSSPNHSQTELAPGSEPIEKQTEELSGQPLSRSETTEYPQGFRLAAVLLTLILSIFFVALDRTILATAIPRITDEFHSLDQVGWYGSSFFVTLAAFQSTWGKLFQF